MLSVVQVQRNSWAAQFKGSVSYTVKGPKGNAKRLLDCWTAHSFRGKYRVSMMDFYILLGNNLEDARNMRTSIKWNISPYD